MKYKEYSILKFVKYMKNTSVGYVNEAPNDWDGTKVGLKSTKVGNH